MKSLSPVPTWILAILLALLFTAVGLSKLRGPSAPVWSERFQNWGYPAGSAHLVGVIEIASALALLLPWTRRVAAASLTIVMLGAFATHLIHGEIIRLISPVLFGTLSFLLFFVPSRAKPALPTS